MKTPKQDPEIVETATYVCMYIYMYICIVLIRVSSKPALHQPKPQTPLKVSQLIEAPMSPFGAFDVSSRGRNRQAHRDRRAAWCELPDAEPSIHTYAYTYV